MTAFAHSVFTSHRTRGALAALIEDLEDISKHFEAVDIGKKAELAVMLPLLQAITNRHLSELKRIMSDLGWPARGPVRAIDDPVRKTILTSLSSNTPASVLSGVLRSLDLYDATARSIVDNYAINQIIREQRDELKTAVHSLRRSRTVSYAE